MTLPVRRLADPVRGYKRASIGLTRDGGATFSSAVGFGTYGVDERAVCRSPSCPAAPGHIAPDPCGTCGFHAYAFAAKALDHGSLQVPLLQVELSGRVIRHERGARAARQRVLAVRFLRFCAACEQAADEAALVVQSDGAIAVVCSACGPSSRGRVVTAGDVAGLLGTEVWLSKLAQAFAGWESAGMPPAVVPVRTPVPTSTWRPRRTPAAVSVRLTSPTPPPALSFEDFVVGDCNLFAHAAACAVAEAPANAYNPLFIYGRSGLGKTHLLAAVGRRVSQLFTDVRVHFVTMRALLDRAVEMIEAGGGHRLAVDADVLLIDDLDLGAQGPRVQDWLADLVDDLVGRGGQVVLAAARPPRHLPTFAGRLRAWPWSLVTDVGAPDLATRAAIVRTEAARRGLPLTEELVFAIAQHVGDSVRELHGAILRLEAAASIYGEPVTIAFAARFLHIDVAAKTRL